MRRRSREKAHKSVAYATGRRRTLQLVALAALMITLPGLVVGFAFVSSNATGSLATSTTLLTAASCGWYYPFNDSSSGPYLATVSGTNGSGTLTLSTGFGFVKGAAFEYLVDEFVFGCTGLTDGDFGIHIYQSSHTAASGTGFTSVATDNYFDVFVAGSGGDGTPCVTTCTLNGVTDGTAPIGLWSSTSTIVCSSVTGAPCSNYPNKPVTNPTAGTACEKPTTASTFTNLFRPYGSVAADTWAWNDSSGAWQSSAAGNCGGTGTSGTYLPPQLNFTATGSVSATDLYIFYSVSIAATNVPTTTEAAVITLKGDMCDGGGATCTVT